MVEFSDTIEDLELFDFPLEGGAHTWFRGDLNTAASRIDRIIFTSEWSEQFKSLTSYVRFSSISAAYNGQCLARLLTLYLVGKKLGRELKAGATGEPSQPVYSGPSGRRGMLGFSRQE
ncbi:hypothetical protein H5410_005684 [Solanum commersonii]|uniref:Uncharacterized protein n=1 Tax=Solanum commersonii TaxID=4109 RepID=A0A9J6A824_SOLCO|nr:hypothetical protein H5410_005684 [Solanum commersonii]